MTREGANAVEAVFESIGGERAKAQLSIYPTLEEQARARRRAQDTGGIELLMDVPLKVNVTLGKCVKTLGDITKLKPDSVIVLDRMAGEMVDVIINGKLFAKAEVIVIDDSYGVRITEMLGR
ncbi:MAG: flagellar motor switch protein FliN [Christensenellales bacterium]|jgi:flagellar motor switch protein FliN/FliY